MMQGASRVSLLFRMNLLPLVLFLSDAISICASFSLRESLVYNRHVRRRTSHSWAQNVKAAKEIGTKVETLTFTCDFTHTSDPIPARNKDELVSFLKENEAKTLLISVGGKRPARRHEMNPELVLLWKETCRESYGEASFPEEGDEIVACESIINFPGLKYISVIYSGTKLVTDANGLPMHEFLLIAEQQRVEGPAPLVWVYRKLTGSSNAPEGTFNRSKGHARSRVSIVQQEGGTCALSFDTTVRVRVDFPSLFVRIMPFPKEKMEEQGSASVLTALSKDVVDAVTLTREAFLSRVDSDE